MKEDVIIIGGGIAGLTVAYALKKQGTNSLVLESSDRLGGRIFTKTSNNLPFELGATWVFEDEQLRSLISELGLELYPQYLQGDALIRYDPAMEIQKSPTEALMSGPVYHKIKGGTSSLIHAIAAHLDADRILPGKKVEQLAYRNDQMELIFADGSIMHANKVVLAVPPAVIARHITITPNLDTQYLMSTTHTWMGESTKFTIFFKKDLWRSENLSGFAYSNYGLIREIQDHTPVAEKQYGLLGFLQPSEELITDKNQRKRVVIRELKELFGIRESDIIGYDDFLWSEYFMDDAHRNYNQSLLPHQNNGHPYYLQPHFDRHLFFAGAETSPKKPGYMEGAVDSAYRAVDLLLDRI